MHRSPIRAGAAVLLALLLAPAVHPGRAPAQGLPAAAYDPSGDDPEAKLAKAAKIYELSMPLDGYTSMLRSLRPIIEQTLGEESERAGREPGEGASERLNLIMAEELPMLMRQLQPKIVALYAGVFTEAELDALLALYGSPEGRSVLLKLPSLSSRIAGATREDLGVFQTRLRKRVAVEVIGE